MAHAANPSAGVRARRWPEVRSRSSRSVVTRSAFRRADSAASGAYVTRRPCQGIAIGGQRLRQRFDLQPQHRAQRGFAHPAPLRRIGSCQPDTARFLWQVRMWTGVESYGDLCGLPIRTLPRSQGQSRQITGELGRSPLAGASDRPARRAAPITPTPTALRGGSPHRQDGGRRPAVASARQRCLPPAHGANVSTNPNGPDRTFPRRQERIVAALPDHPMP